MVETRHGGERIDDSVALRPREFRRVRSRPRPDIIRRATKDEVAVCLFSSVIFLSLAFPQETYLREAIPIKHKSMQ